MVPQTPNHALQQTPPQVLRLWGRSAVAGLLSLAVRPWGAS